MNKYLLRFVVATFAFISLGLVVYGQTGSYAITNARIVTVSGSNISNGTVVIRDGLIESVGANIKVPTDAKIFDGKGLTVYPGFIDTYTNLGIQKAAPRPTGGARNQTSSVSNYPAGLRPEQMAADRLKSGDAQFKSQRNNGFTTALTVDSNGIFQGQSAIINLAGDSVSSMLLRSSFAQHVTFRTIRGSYPGALLGTFSALRQMFLDAKRLDTIKKAYSRNPRGMKRPEADPSLEALIPVVTGKSQIVFTANTERQIIRALNLAKEFNLKAVISGGMESWKVADRLKAANVPVLLSLNFPKRTLSASKDADPESMDTLRLRVRVPKNAATLKQAGVKFAFQSGGLKNLKDYFTNAMEATKNGLQKADAIRAMTLSSAEILGVDNQLGSIEKGKIANLVVTKGDIFAKDKAVTHVFVDGKLFEQPKKKAKKKTDSGKDTSGEIAKVGGTWKLTVEPPGQSIEVTLTLDQQGDTITGTLNSPLFGNVQIKNGKVTEDGMNFEATVSVGGQELDVSFAGKVDGNKVEGTVDSAQGPVAFSGTKNP